MTRELRVTNSFKRDYKKLCREDKEATDGVIQKLLANQPLEPRNRDHNLHGNYEEYRECHVKPDLLLVYTRTQDNEILLLTCYRVSSHTNIFDTKRSRK